MAISIKGVNTGVIRKSNNFIALALKIKEPRNKESLFFYVCDGTARPFDSTGKPSVSQA